IILMIADGWSAKHIEATNKYCETTFNCDIPLYQTDSTWKTYYMTTYPIGGSYDPNQAWSDFEYVKSGYTDSAAAATALYTGMKTQKRRIAVSQDGSIRLYTIGEKAKDLGKSVGALTTVGISDATPGTICAHNDDRGNTYAIADECLFGDPNTTGDPSIDSKYSGGHGPTFPPIDVMIGAGSDERSAYINTSQKDKLRMESGEPGKHYFVERRDGEDGGDNLMSAANDPNVTMLAGLFDQVYRLADGSGYNPENPTLAESVQAALTVLEKNPKGFVLMVEGGAVDRASHANNMNQMIGEMIDFNEAVRTVVDWVEDTTNDSSWANTLVIVTGDHDCGYLTAGPGVFPDKPLGVINSTTIANEKIDLASGLKASWNDTDGDDRIDPGETLYWAWNSSGHTN
ncbi:MAG: alkaline phosphatase, partial [Nitrospirae bacterium]